MKYIKARKVNESPMWAPTDPKSGRNQKIKTGYNSQDGGSKYKYSYTIITKDKLGDRVDKNLSMEEVNFLGNHFTVKNDEELEYFRNKYKEGDMYEGNEIAYTMTSPFSSGMGVFNAGKRS